MRAFVQRVSSASVTVDGEVVGALASPGLLVYLGLTHTDSTDAFCAALAALGAHVERGVFGAEMAVASVNDGPFTVLLER